VKHAKERSGDHECCYVRACSVSASLMSLSGFDACVDMREHPSDIISVVKKNKHYDRFTQIHAFPISHA